MVESPFPILETFLSQPRLVCLRRSGQNHVPSLVPSALASVVPGQAGDQGAQLQRDRLPATARDVSNPKGGGGGAGGDSSM